MRVKAGHGVTIERVTIVYFFHSNSYRSYARRSYKSKNWPLLSGQVRTTNNSATRDGGHRPELGEVRSGRRHKQRRFCDRR